MSTLRVFLDAYLLHTCCVHDYVRECLFGCIYMYINKYIHTLIYRLIRCTLYFLLAGDYGGLFWCTYRYVWSGQFLHTNNAQHLSISTNYFFHPCFLDPTSKEHTTTKIPTTFIILFYIHITYRYLLFTVQSIGYTTTVVVEHVSHSRDCWI